MASGWATALPRITLRRTSTRKAVTLVLPYYENHDFLRQQVAHWREYDESTRRHTRVIIVDDGSPAHTAAHSLAPLDVPVNLRLFRIGVDVPWNWLAARNIGAYHAADGWLLLTDMDHLVPPDTMQAVQLGHHDPRVVYAFARREHSGAVIAPHSASFLLTKAMFWTIGGYDETLSGHYGTDGDFRRRLSAVAPTQVLTDQLVRYEYVADSSTTRYQRKLPADEAAVRRLIAKRGADFRPKTLSFPYEEVSC